MKKVLIMSISSLLLMGKGEAVVMIHPRTSPIVVSIAVVSSNVANLTWDAQASRGYIIESKMKLNIMGNWDTFLIDKVEGPKMSRLVAMRMPTPDCNPEGDFFRILPTAMFGVGETVPWRVAVEGLLPDSLQKFSVRWSFDDGVTVELSTNEWHQRVNKIYDRPGIKTATAEIMYLGDLFLTKKWAVTVTNGVVDDGSNLIVNGNLEQMDGSKPLGWFSSGIRNNIRTFTYPVAGRDGGHAAHLSISDYVDGDAKWYFDDVTLVAGAYYKFSHWYKSSRSVNLTARYLHADGHYTYPQLTTAESSADWQKAEIEFTVPPEVVSLTIFHALTGNGELTIDDAELVKVPPPPSITGGAVAFDFDDGWRQSNLTGSQILQSRGYRGTFYVVMERIGRPGILSSNDLMSLQSIGHEIGAHSVSHRDLASLDVETMRWELAYSRHTLISWGLWPVSSVVYPFGSFNDEVLQAARESGYAMGVSTMGGLNAKDPADLFALRRTSVRSTHTVEEFKSQIDQAVAENKLFMMAFHQLSEGGRLLDGGGEPTDYTVSTSFLAELVDYVHSLGVPVVTASGALRLLTEE